MMGEASLPLLRTFRSKGGNVDIEVEGKLSAPRRGRVCA